MYHLAHANVTTLIRIPGMEDKASAQAVSVAPVVSTSSTSRICLSASEAACTVAAKSPSVFCQRS